MKTCMFSIKLKGLQKTFEIHCQPLHIKEDMFYFQSIHHPLTACIMYTISEASHEGYFSTIANSLVKLVDVTWYGKDLALKFDALVPIIELLLVKNSEMWTVFESLGLFVKSFFITFYMTYL